MPWKVACGASDLADGVRRAVLSCRAILLTLPVACMGCLAPAPTVEVSIHGTNTSNARSRVSLTGAINETVDLQLTFRPRDRAVVAPDIGIVVETGGDGALQAGSVRVFRMQAVTVDRFPGWHIRDVPRARRNASPLDVLVPLHAPIGGIPRTLAKDDSLPVWIDVNIPKGTAAGTHRLAVELRSGQTVVAAVDIELSVRPLVLPDDSDPALLIELDRAALHDQLGESPDELDRVIRSTMRLLQEHGLNPVLPTLVPRIAAVGRGEPRLDWADYDGLAGPMLDGSAFLNRKPLRHWPLPLTGVLSGGTVQSDPNLRPSNAFLRAYARDVIEHFRQKGWLDRAYALPTTQEETDWLTAIPRSDHAPIRIVHRAFPQDAAPDGWVGFQPYLPIDSFDTWLSPAQFFDPAAMHEERAAGRRTWMNMDRPPFSGTTSVFGQPTDARILSWQGLALDAEAIHLGSANPWPQVPGALSPENCLRFDDRTLLFPGRPFGQNEPVASVRLKQLRRAKQDASYLRLLADRGLKGLETSLCHRLARFAGTQAYRTHFADGRTGGWARDEAVFDRARDILVEALVSDRMTGSAADRSRAVVTSDSWRRLVSETNEFDLRIDGSRVHWRGAPPNVRAEVEVTATIRHFGEAPVSGSLRFTDPPADWSIGEQAAVEVRPERDFRLHLRATMPSLVTDRAGLVSLPIEFVGSDGARARTAARVAWAQTARLGRAPRIDGDLSDWSAGTSNVAADFTSVTGSDVEASSKTTALLGRDDRYLYVGILCESPHLDASRPPLARRKGIQFDDLIPVDEEDLIEILLDPNNAGSRSPSDLLHIAVKRSGTDLAEKGIGTDPPCAVRTPWAVDLQLATVETARGWSTEIRLPLTAVADEIDPTTVWGFNITRWDATGREFSTWAGAVGDAYDPLSLGNLYLP